MRFDILALVILGLFKIRLIKRNELDVKDVLSMINRITLQIIFLPEGQDISTNPSILEQLASVSKELKATNGIDDVDLKIANILDDIAYTRKTYTQEEIEKILRGMYG